jgi:Protein of unknown function (DUF4446)
VADLNQWLLDNLWVVVGAWGLVLLGLVGAVVILGRRLSKATAAYRALVDETTGTSLSGTLDAQAARLVAVDRRLAEVDGRYRLLESRSRGSLQHVGLVRFNPFEDTGSDQSFAIALLDDDQSGIVISSLHGRGGTRIFAKPIQAGQASHALSDEEQKAVDMASGGLRDADAQRDR